MTDLSPQQVAPNAPRTGYRLTKLGWIPEDWEVMRISDITTVRSGTTPETSRLDFWEGGTIPWLPTGKVNDRIIESASDYITNKALEEKGIKLLPENTILVAMIGQGKTRGMCAIMKISAWVNQNFAYILPCEEANSDFLFYFLESKYGYIRYEGQRGGSQGSLNTSMVRRLVLPLPPLAEQRRIAAILSTWDRAIAQGEALLAQLRLRNRGLAQQLLTGETRVAGFEGKWEEVRLGEIAERVNRKNAELNDNVVTISAQRGFVRQEEFFNKRVASEELQGYLLLKKGEFAYNKSYSNGYPMGAFKRLDDYEKAVVTTLYICFRLKTGTDPDFLLQYFEAGRIVKGLMRIAQEGGRAHGLLNISLGDFFNLKLIMPPLPEQQAIARILQAADAEVAAQEARLTALREQKRGLMQGLLTGAVRVFM